MPSPQDRSMHRDRRSRDKDPSNLSISDEDYRIGESAFQWPYAGPKALERSSSSEDNGRVFGGSSRANRVYSDDYAKIYKQGTSPLQPTSGQHGYSDRRDHGGSSSYVRHDQNQESIHLNPNQTLAMQGHDPATPENRKSGTPFPKMSVEEGISLKRQGRRFPREDLFMELKGRDHVSGGQFST